MSFNRMYEGNCYNYHSINNNLEIRAQGLSNNQMLESSVCCHSNRHRHFSFRIIIRRWRGKVTYYSILFYENEIKKFSYWKRSDLWLKEQARLYLQLSWIKSRMNWWNIKTINTIYEWCSANWQINYYSTETIKYIFYLILCRTFK